MHEHPENRGPGALTDGRLLPPAQLAEMETTIPVAQLAAIWPGAGYGLGLAFFPLSCDEY